MVELLEIINQAIVFLTLLATLGLGVFVILWVLERAGLKLSFFVNLKDYLKGIALPASFLIALGSIIGSLFYSNALGYEPCVLCWWARVLIYPQAFILGLAWTKKDNSIFYYLLPLSFVGLIMMAYNQALQLEWIGESSFICGTGESASCAIRFVFESGFITIPWMAFVAFGWLIILGTLGKKEVAN